MLCMCTFTSANTALDMSAELPVAEDDAAVVGLEEARLCASKQKRYEFVRSLGQGAFGVVLLARDLESQGGRREVAVKIIKAKGSVLQSLFGSRPSQVKDGKVEAEMLFQLRHESIVEIIDKYEFKKKRNFGLGIVTEFCSNGNLQQHLESNRHPSRTRRLTWYKQLSSALEFIHSKGIVHRDLKPANVLVDSSENLKVADVGLAKTFYKEKSINSKVGRGNSTYLEFMTSAAGTPLYMAPEMWSNRYKRSCDVFSLGLVFVMISECPNPMWPFALWNNNLSTLGEVLFNNPKAREVDSVGLLYPQVQYAGKDEVSLLKGMLTYNMDSRPSMRRVREEVEKMMEAVEPTETPTWLINVFFVVVAIVMFLLLRYFLFV